TSLTQAYPAPPRSSWCSTIPGETATHPRHRARCFLEGRVPSRPACPHTAPLVEMELDPPKGQSPDIPGPPPGSVKHSLTQAQPAPPRSSWCSTIPGPAPNTPSHPLEVASTSLTQAHPAP